MFALSEDVQTFKLHYMVRPCGLVFLHDTEAVPKA